MCVYLAIDANHVEILPKKQKRNEVCYPGSYLPIVSDHDFKCTPGLMTNFVSFAIPNYSLVLMSLAFLKIGMFDYPKGPSYDLVLRHSLWLWNQSR